MRQATAAEVRRNASAILKAPRRMPVAEAVQKFMRVYNNEEISEEAQREMAVQAEIDEARIDDIANFLNQWGNE